jgi:hypothetical protein
MKNDSLESTVGRRVSVGEIAQMSGVGPSAVSNWRNRHSDFPLPVAETSSGDLFDMQAVVSWLQAHDKEVQIPQREWDGLLWSTLDRFRGAVRLDEAVTQLLQVIFLYQRKDKEGFNACWKELVASDPGALPQVWEQCVQKLTETHADLGRVLTMPTGVDGELMKNAIEAVSSSGMPLSEAGAAATALLYRYQDTLGAHGVLSTPESVTKLQVGLLRPIGGAVYDPACGAAMVLAEAWAQRESEDAFLFGQDVNAHSWRLGFLHLSLHGAQFTLSTGDTIRDDRFRSLHAQRIAADPPFTAKAYMGPLTGDERWSYGLPRRSADWLWAQVAIHHLAEDGIGVITMAPGALTTSGIEQSIRAAIVKDEVLDVVIDLPPGLWAGTKVPAALLVFARRRQNRSGHVLFIDARQLGQPRRGRPHELGKADVEQIVHTVKGWRDGRFEDQPRFAASAGIDRILENGVDLSPNRYVRYSTPVREIDGEPIPARLDRLRAETGRLSERTGARVPELVDTFAKIAGRDEDLYELVKISDILTSKIQAGTRKDITGEGQEVPYVETGLISTGYGRLERLSEEVTRGNPRGRLVSHGDLLLVSRGLDPQKPVGCAVVEFHDQAAYSESLLRLRPDRSRVDPLFLWLFLTSHQGRAALAAATTGSVIGNLRPEALGEIMLPLPPMPTQQAIAAATERILGGLADVEDFLRTASDALDVVREVFIAGSHAPVDAL